MTGKVAALYLEGVAPSVAAQTRLGPPFEQMQQQHDQLVDPFALFTFADAPVVVIPDGTLRSRELSYVKSRTECTTVTGLSLSVVRG